MFKTAHAKDLLANLGNVWTDTKFQDKVSRATSMSIQGELSSRRSKETQLGDMYAVSLLAQNAAALSFMTERVSIDAGSRGIPDVATSNAHRLAKLWESLSKICPPAASEAFSLNAACAYELAGYQANARCMARRIEDGRSGDEKANLQKAVSMFLQRRFVQLRSYCEPIVAEPDYEKVENIQHRLALAAAAAALSDFAGCLLSGSRPETDGMVRDLGDAERLFHMSGFHGESSLAHSIKSLLGSMWSRSTWSALDGKRDGGGGHFAWNRYLTLLARGLGSPVPSGPSISEMWPSQLVAVDSGLLSSDESKIVRMPTSAGKTRIAEMSILHALVSGVPPRRCVYVAPYRALVSEVTRSLSLVFPDLGFSVSGMDGAYDATPLDLEGDELPDILVLTPEKLDIIARTSQEKLDDTALFVIDEGHVVGHGARGARIEMLLTRLRRRFDKSRFILLSAMLSDGAMRRFAAWLRCGGAAPEGSGIICTEWRPTTQRVAKFEWDQGRCRLTYEPLRFNLGQHEMVDKLIDAVEFQYNDPKTGRKRARKFPGPQKGEIAAELAFRYATLGPVLVYTPSPKNVMSVARKMHDRVRLAAGTAEGTPAHFQDHNRRSADVSAEWLGPDHTVTRLLRAGIAAHHGSLPHALRGAIESDMARGEIRAIVATNTLSQGVNLPVRTIVVHSCKRYDEKSDRMVRIPDGEYWNLAGRAGRAGHETEGTVIHIVMTPSDARDFDHYAAVRDDMRDDDAGSGLYKMLADLAQDRLSDDDLASVMDTEILGIMVEEGARNGCEDIAMEVVASSLAALDLRDEPSAKKAYGRIRDRAREIGAEASGPVDAATFRAYGGTGLRMQSCARLAKYIDENEVALRRLVAPEGAGRACDLAALIMNALGEVTEMGGDLEYDGDRGALLESWMGGETVHNALKKVGTDDKGVEEAAKFIGTAFGHYMPWGVSAFLKIAAARLGMREEDLPDHAKYLPEMVRHGVPAPEHSWTMRLGIPTKSAAMQMCSRLRPTTPRELARMISEMGVEGLTEYGISADAAADIVGAALRREVNPLLREGRSLEEVIGKPARIAGIGKGQWYASMLAAGDKVEIRRDYDDPADRNAMAVYAGGRHVGHIEGRVAQYLAPLVDAGMPVSALVTSTERGVDGAPEVAVRLSVRGRTGTAQA